MKPLFMLALSFLAFNAFGQTRRIKIAHLENGICKIDADTVTLKKLWLGKCGFEGVDYTKIEVLKKQTFGEKKEDFYMLIAYDPSKDLKTSRYLFKINDNFYFRPSKGTDNNDLFLALFLPVWVIMPSASPKCFIWIILISGEVSKNWNVVRITTAPLRAVLFLSRSKLLNLCKVFRLKRQFS